MACRGRNDTYGASLELLMSFETNTSGTGTLIAPLQPYFTLGLYLISRSTIGEVSTRDYKRFKVVVVVLIV